MITRASLTTTILLGVLIESLTAVITSDPLGGHRTTPGQLAFGISMDGVVLIAAGLPEWETLDDLIADCTGALITDRHILSAAHFVMLAKAYGAAGGWASGDFDGSGNVQFEDFVILENNYGKSAVAAVFEPSSGTLLAVALVGLMVCRCWKSTEASTFCRVQFSESVCVSSAQ